MFTIKDFEVELVNKEQVKGFIKEHGRFASVCYNTDEKYAEKVGENCLKSGHLSGSRHLYFVFKIKRVPRFLIDQLVRHEQGVVKNVQSLRYCTKVDDDSNIDIYRPSELENSTTFKFEDIEENIDEIMYWIYDYLERILKIENKEKINEIVRTICPIGVASECSFAVNLEGLIHLANIRLCNRAELPIRHLTKMMIDEVLEIEPRYTKYLVPNCIKYGHCPEGSMSCGKIKKIREKFKELEK